MVCIDEPRATRLNPCEHSALCAECARECQDHHGVCPICNTAIKAIEYGTFMGTFAPSDTANFDSFASAIKKAGRRETRQPRHLNHPSHPHYHLTTSSTTLWTRTLLHKHLSTLCLYGAT